MIKDYGTSTYTGTLDSDIKLKRKFTFNKQDNSTVICGKSINHIAPLISSSKYSVSYFTNKNRRKRFARLVPKQKPLIRKSLWPDKRYLLLKPYVRKNINRKNFFNIFPEFRKEGFYSYERLRISEQPFGNSGIQSLGEEYKYLKSLYGYFPAAFILPRYYAVRFDKTIWSSDIFLLLFNYLFIVGVLILFLASPLYSMFYLKVPFTVVTNSTIWGCFFLLLILFHSRAELCTELYRKVKQNTKLKSSFAIMSPSSRIEKYLLSNFRIGRPIWKTLRVSLRIILNSWRCLFLFIACTVNILTMSIKFTHITICFVMLTGLFLSAKCWRIQWKIITMDLTNLIFFSLLFHLTPVGYFVSSTAISTLRNVFFMFIKISEINQEDILDLTIHEKHNVVEKHEIIVSIVSIITSSFMSVLHHLNKTKSLVMTAHYITFFFLNCTPIVAFFLCNLILFEFSSILQCLAPLFCILTPHEMLICCVAGITKLSLYKISFLKVRYGVHSLYLVSSVFMNTIISVFFVRLVRPEKHKSFSTCQHLEQINTAEGNNWVDAFLAGGLNAIRVSLLSIAIAVILASLVKLTDIILNHLPELLFCFFDLEVTLAKLLAFLFMPLFAGLYKLSLRTAFLAGYLFSMKLIVYNYDPFDYLFRHHIAIRWISDCWRVSFGLRVYENMTHTIYHDHYTNLVYALPGKELLVREEIVILQLLMHNFDLVNILQMFAIMTYHIIHRKNGALSVVKNTILISFLVILFSACQVININVDDIPISCDIQQKTFCQGIYLLFHKRNLDFDLGHVCTKIVSETSHRIRQRYAFL